METKCPIFNNAPGFAQNLLMPPFYRFINSMKGYVLLMRYKLAPYGEAMVGKGAYVSSHVCRRLPILIFSNEQSSLYKAFEERSERQAAIKKSRVLRTVKLQHKTRVLRFYKVKPLFFLCMNTVNRSISSTSLWSFWDQAHNRAAEGWWWCDVEGRHSSHGSSKCVSESVRIY